MKRVMQYLYPQGELNPVRLMFVFILWTILCLYLIPKLTKPEKNRVLLNRLEIKNTEDIK